MILETKRLLLREMKRDDYDALHEVLADPENMRHYPYSFDEEKIRGWIEQNITRYGKYGFGLWAVCLKNTGKMIGDCGLTLQCIEGEMLPEIGYHIRRDCQRNGYAKEAAMAVRDWAFQNTVYPALYSYCKSTNEASIRTAEAIGMRFDREYPDKDNGITHVSVIYHRDMIMNDYIAYCGLDCEKCEARLASVNDDNELRIKVSKKWSELNGVEITPEMINCSGCRIPGGKPMIYELTDISKVKHLFEGWNDTLIYSCLQKVMGKIFVTEMDSPVSAMAYVGCFAFYAGVPDKELVRHKPDGFVIMTPQNETFQTKYLVS